ncbi:hypothetical protein Tco_1217200 [Tanacetum coccineum]
MDHEHLEQLDEFDLEEMDLKWQVAMISMRIKKFYKKAGKRLHFDAKEPRNQESRRRDAWNSGYKAKDNGTRPGKQEETKALVTLDGDVVDWTSHSEDEQDNYAFMAFSSPGSDTEREQLGDASIKIQAYTQALKKVEAQLVAYQQNQLCQMSARDKAELEYGDQMNKGDACSSPVVPPPKIGNYIPYGLDIEIDYSQFTYGLKQSQPSESETQTSDFDTCESDCSVETHKSLPEPTVNKPKVVSQPKI